MMTFQLATSQKLGFFHGASSTTNAEIPTINGLPGPLLSKPKEQLNVQYL